MGKKCAKCGRPIATKKLYCDECTTLTSGEEKVEVVLELTLDELGTVTTALAEEAANFRYSGGGDWDTQAETLEKVAEAFRNAPQDERSREAEDAHIQWLYAQD